MSRAAADASVFHAIADPTRRALLVRLRDGERPVAELAEPFDATLGAISQHLAVLRRAGLVSDRRVGRQRWYRLRPEPLAEVLDWIAYFDRFWEERLAGLGSYLERRGGSDRGGAASGGRRRASGARSGRRGDSHH